ncbi:PREDICTED: membrane-spanning 4-domains subfamily A member 15-like [Thamnophis sirtalis]|uniref:Membrane-spanning 4-domains subfamily A member 15-like n=1 Tax=Thamnophis sirtalis TaxID=35019 RepID=A0A6I9YN28_9SAUR|nr:PREDICTED: membrane-spanning 4-domains subfamily A member 15-like [Thamnophis sirtalis]
MDAQPVVLSVGSSPYTTQSDFPVPLKKFYQGEPLALGITQIFIGIVGIIFGILFDVTRDYFVIYSEIKMPYWSGILYIISGSLAVVAARNPRMPLVQSMVAMNVLSTVAAGLGLASLFVSFSVLFPFDLSWYCHNLEIEIQEKCNPIRNIGRGILIVLTLFTALEFCITVSVASFGCKMLCRDTFPEKIVVVYQNVSPARAEQCPPLDCKQEGIQS